MITERLLCPTEEESANTSSLKGQFLQSLKTSDEYRYSFVEEKIQSGLAAQIRAIREQRQLDPKHFAEKLGKKVSWVYRLEDPNLPPPTIPSLLEVARAYDVDLEVRFRPFSAFLNEVDGLSTRSLEVASFRDELPELERDAARDQKEVEYQALLAAASPAPLDAFSDYYASAIPTSPIAWNSLSDALDYFEAGGQHGFGDKAQAWHERLQLAEDAQSIFETFPRLAFLATGGAIKETQPTPEDKRQVSGLFLVPRKRHPQKASHRGHSRKVSAIVQEERITDVA